MRILHLYRPRLPSFRAQAIQVLHACHSLAARGHEVTLLADRGSPAMTPADVLGTFGLPPVEGLELRINPRSHRGLAGIWFRRELARWWAGPPGVVLARDKRRLAQALKRHGKAGHVVVLEAHGLDSLQAADSVRATRARALEAEVLAQTDALITNCGGTLGAWQDSGHTLPGVVTAIHNGTGPDRLRQALAETEPVIRSVGSPKAYKGVDLMLEAASRLPLPLELVGGSDEERAELARSSELVRLRAPVPYPAVPMLLASSRMLLLSLADNDFGRRLTSPLKLWDYLATSVPILAPDLPTVREIQALSQAPFYLYDAGDADSLVAAALDALDAPSRSPFLRTWGERAAEVEAALLAAGGLP